MAKMVVVSSRLFNPTSNAALSSPRNIGIPEIRCLAPSNRSITFTDGRTAYDVDRVVFCSGHVYDFSFIQEGGATGDRKLFEAGVKVADVYEHLVYTEDHTLFFVGLPKMSAAFTIAEAQSAVVAQLVAGRSRLWLRTQLRKLERQAREEWRQQTSASGLTKSDYHSFRLSADEDYVNFLLQ